MPNDTVPLTDRRLPPLTVAVCTRNRGARIAETVASVLANDIVDIELLIVDQSTNDESEQAVRAFLPDPRIRYVRSETVGIGTSRALAVDLATHEIVAFTDDDCTVPVTWAETIIHALQEHPEIGMLYCNVRPAPYDPALGFVPTHERRGVHTLRTMRDKCRGRGIGAGMAVRRSVVLQVGNFDRALGSFFPRIVGEEGDLTVRMLLAGYPVLETDATWVEHDGFRTWEQGKDLTRRNFIGIGLVCAKPIRAGKWRATIVVLYEGVVIALLKPLSPVLRLKAPRGLKAFPYFWLGFARGLRTPVDRRTLNFDVDSA